MKKIKKSKEKDFLKYIEVCNKNNNDCKNCICYCTAPNISPCQWSFEFCKEDVIEYNKLRINY